MAYYRFTRLQQYINGQPTDVYSKGERVDDVDYSTYDECMGGTADTRWVSMPQTVCYNGDLWSMEKEEISYDGGTTWSDTGNTRRASVIEPSASQCTGADSDWRVVYGEYICDGTSKCIKEAEYINNSPTGRTRAGSIVELLSEDCGVMYQWVDVPGEYVCVYKCGRADKYTKQKQQYSIDGGLHWDDTGETREGNFIEKNSADCGCDTSITRWITVSEEYVCVGASKYTKEKEQTSTDGTNWTDTGNTRAGSLIETSSSSCASTRWVTVSGQYSCVGTDKYNLEKEQTSTDGTNWTDTGNTRAGSTLIEANSTDCGYAPQPITQWVSDTGYVCVGYDKMNKEKEQISYDSGSTWSDTGATRAGSTLIEANSTDCGYVPQPITQWVADTGYVCVGFDKYNKEKEQISYDNGATWADTGNTRAGSNLIETNSEDCGYIEPIYQWVSVSGEYVCVGYDKYNKEKQQVSYDNGATWEDTGETRTGSTLIEQNSEDCGYVYLLARKHYRNGNTVEIPGRGRLTYNEYGQSGISDIVVADILEGTTILDAFALGGNCYAGNYPNYEYIYFYSENLTEIGQDFYNQCDNTTVPLKYMGPVERAVDGKIIIPGNVKTVGPGIADGLLYITEVYFDDGVETIGRLSNFGADSDCVTTVRLPSTLTSLSTNMFIDLHGLTTVNNFPNVTALPEGLFRYCTSFTSFTIPSTVTSIGQYAFSESGITSITVPDSVQTIGRHAFIGCESLETVTLGDGLTSIEAYTFGGCTSLKTLTVGESVTTIDGRWLDTESGDNPQLTSLESIIFNSSTPPSWHDVSSAGAWSKAPNARIYVPCDYVQAYRQAWTDVATRIEGYNCGQSTDYLTFQALEAGTIKLTSSNATTNNLKYSKNDGEWTDIATGTAVSVETGDIIKWKGTLQSISNNGSRKFVATCRFNASGNPLSIVYENFGDVTDISAINGCLRSLFQDTMVVDASGLSLTATTLSQYCYTRMFSGCTYLTSAPALPATTITKQCYQEMFYGCTSLTVAPALPATTITKQCYQEMFAGCTSLTTAPVLPATTLAQYAYQEMFYGCSSLNYIKAMFTSTPGSYNTSSWVYGVASEGTFVKNSAATWNVVGSSGVPSGWTIETASE